jgi:hypothetical protein
MRNDSEPITGYLVIEEGTGEPVGYRRLLDHAWELATEQHARGRPVKLYSVRLTEIATVQRGSARGGS